MKESNQLLDSLLIVHLQLSLFVQLYAPGHLSISTIGYNVLPTFQINGGILILIFVDCITMRGIFFLHRCQFSNTVSIIPPEFSSDTTSTKHEQ